jgi:hypothetical protein
MELIAVSGLPKLSQARAKRGHSSAGHQSEEAVRGTLVGGGLVGLQVLDIRNPGIFKSVDHPTMWCLSIRSPCPLRGSQAGVSASAAATSIPMSTLGTQKKLLLQWAEHQDEVSRRAAALNSDGDSDEDYSANAE